MKNPHSGRYLIGKRFGKLIVIGGPAKIHFGTVRHWAWLCLCDCGGTKWSSEIALMCGGNKSCGCLVKGATHDSLYKRWVGMLQRCENPNNVSYKNYGGRGIRVCERWHNFDAFNQDIGPLLKNRKWQIDRIDNEGDYEPSNVRIVPASVNLLNRRNTRWVTVNGEMLPLKTLSDRTGLGMKTLEGRLKRGDKDDALVRPPEMRSNLTPVIQKTRDGEFVKEWECISDAQRWLESCGKGSKNIGHCCRGERETAGGYRWEYVRRN